MKIIYLTKAQYEELLADGTTTTTGGTIINYNEQDMYCVESDIRLFKHTIGDAEIVTNSSSPIETNAGGGFYIANHFIISSRVIDQSVQQYCYGVPLTNANGNLVGIKYWDSNSTETDYTLDESDTDQVEELS